MDSLICRIIRMDSTFDQRHAKNISFGTVAIFAVVHQADSVSGFGIIRPLVSNGFKFCHIPAGILIGRTFYISVLDIKSCLAGTDIQWEKNSQKLLMLMPVCMGDKVDPAVVIIKTDFL